MVKKSLWCRSPTERLQDVSLINLENMTNIKSKDLTLSDLALNAVWTWSSDLMRCEDTLVSVEMTREGLAEADTLLIHAMFKTAGGANHEGLIVYDPDLDDVFAIELFLDKARITLNKNAGDLSNLELERYEAFTGRDRNSVLPIRYQIVTSELPLPPAEFTLKDYWGK